ncbi:integrase [Shigella flexneri]
MNSQTVIRRSSALDSVVYWLHGLRSIASTALDGKAFHLTLSKPRLAHVGKNEVRRAYNRSDSGATSADDAMVADFVMAADRGSMIEGGIKGMKLVG